MELRSAGCSVIVPCGKIKGQAAGQPGIRQRQPEMLAKMTATQKEAYGKRIQVSLNQWLGAAHLLDPTARG